MTEIFLDIETTGLSFKDNHKIVEIACVETKELIPTKKIFHTLINPERDVPDEAFRIHGHSSDLLKKQPTFKEIATKFLTFIEDKELIIHNASFDLSVALIRHEGHRSAKVMAITPLSVPKSKTSINWFGLNKSIAISISNSVSGLGTKVAEETLKSK